MPLAMPFEVTRSKSRLQDGQHLCYLKVFDQPISIPNMNTASYIDQVISEVRVCRQTDKWTARSEILCSQSFNAGGIKA